MYALRLLQAFSLASLVVSLPHSDVHTNQLTKRVLPPVDEFPSDPTSQNHKSLLSEALSDSLLLVQQVSLSYPGDDGSGPFKDIWSKYFPDTDHQKVQGVWNKIMSDPNNPGQGEDVLRTAVILGVDLLKQYLNADTCLPGEDAYTNPLPTGFDPGLPGYATFTFFCDQAFQAPARYGDISCSTVGDTLSTKMDFLAGTILHEWMHNDNIGKDGTGGAHIADYSTPQDSQAGYGPYKTRQLLKNQPDQCITNADSFLWLAYEILWTKACLSGDTRFKDPAVDNTVATAALDPSAASPFTVPGTLTNNVVQVTAVIPPFTPAAAAAPTPTCDHAADPDGAMGYCPNLSNDGWCDCGSAGDFPILPGSSLCAYTSLPASTLQLTSTSCISAAPTTALITETVVPIPASTA